MTANPKKPFRPDMMHKLLEALRSRGIAATISDGHKKLANKCTNIDRSVRRRTDNKTLFTFYVKYCVAKGQLIKPAPRAKRVDGYTAPSRIDFILSDAFYSSREWMELRYKALTLHGARCMCCGATPGDGVKMHVDHIRPRSKFPELALRLDNMQILCEPCNLGKSNKDDTDWRGALDQESDIFLQALDRFVAANKHPW